jgi:hypothetical protein
MRAILGQGVASSRPHKFEYVHLGFQCLRIEIPGAQG